MLLTYGRNVLELNLDKPAAYLSTEYHNSVIYNI